MRERSYIIGSAAAAAAMLLAASMPPLTRTTIDPPSPKPVRRFKQPVNSGPVIDTTPESKRAKRRRLTREFKRAKRLSTPTN